MRLRIYILLIIISVLTGCLGTKKVTESSQSSKVVDKSEVVKDSSTTTETSKAIDDKAVFKIPESNTGDADIDRRINEGVANVLRSINFQKNSGDNSYKLYYDEKLRELRAEFEIGETQNKETATKESSKIEKTWEETLIENTKKTIKIIPWWGWLILIYALRKNIISVIAIFAPGIKGIKTINDLLNPPNRNDAN